MTNCIKTGGCHWYFGPSFSCAPVIQVHIKAPATEHVVSIPVIVLLDVINLMFYISFHHKYLMLIVSDVIWVMDYATKPGQVVHVE